jgi:hypothetical protein
MADAYGISRTANVLRMSYDVLKKRLAQETADNRYLRFFRYFMRANGPRHL